MAKINNWTEINLVPGSDKTINVDQASENIELAVEFYKSIQKYRESIGIYPSQNFLDSELYGNMAFAKISLLYSRLSLNFPEFLLAVSKEHKIKDRKLKGLVLRKDIQKSLNPDYKSFNSLHKYFDIGNSVNPKYTGVSLRQAVEWDFKTPKGEQNKHAREKCSEFKILEGFLKYLNSIGIKKEQFESITGDIEIFTEREVCVSCANVIRMFAKLFPNINITTIGGLGKEPIYSKDGVVLACSLESTRIKMARDKLEKFCTNQGGCLKTLVEELNKVG
jgi:The  BURPS668_1122 family of deaminases